MMRRTAGGGHGREFKFALVAALGLVSGAARVPAADNVAGTLINFDNDGMWSWYMDERAIVDTLGDANPLNDRLLIGGNSSSPVRYPTGRPTGSVDVFTYDVATGDSDRFQLSDIQEDDHNAPGLIILPDGRYLAMYSNHGNTGGLGDEFTRWRRSLNPGDSTSWTSEQTFNWFTQTPGVNPGGSPDAANVAYHNLFYLSAEDQVYNISRSFGQAPNITRYDIDSNTMEWAGQLADSSIGGYSTGYFKYASNGVDRIYFTHTETHPRNYNTSIYSGYIEDGQSFDMLGNLTDADIFDNETAAGGSGDVPDVLEFTVVQQADPLGAGYNRLWTVDMNLDAAGQPMALYVSRWNPDGSTSAGSTTNPIDHRLHFSHWNEASSQWDAYEVARMGNRLYRTADMSEQDYTGNAALVPGDPNTLYISTPYDPRDPSGATFTTEYEIYKGVTADGGANWAWTAVTENSAVDNLRPIVPAWDQNHTAVVWMRGTYTTAQNTDLAVVGIIERQDETLGLVHYVDASTSNTTRANGSALAATGPSTAEGSVDSNWHWRTGSGNNSDVLASGGAGSENAPTIRTTLSGLADGTYDIFAYFLANPTEDWRLQAGFSTSDMMLYRDNGAQQAEASQFDPLDPAVVLTGPHSALYRAYIGRTVVSDGSLVNVFIDDFSANLTTRTWYDGLGYARVRVPEPSAVLLLFAGAMAGLVAGRRRGRT